ncbi:MAG TPA: hypothetical protein P5092_07970 [Ruminococcus sp.]|nr:hypothetical protein [Ruminococcus sp.]
MMMMSKLAAFFAAAVVALVPMQFPAAFAEDKSGFTAEEIEKSEVKPTISLPKITITEEEAKKSPNRRISLTVEGASKKFATVELWTSFDKRLQVSKDSDGRPSAEKGGSLQYFNSYLCASKYFDTKTKKVTDLNGVRLIASASGNYGVDGELFSITVKLPSDVKAGDEFPLEIVDVERDTVNNKYVNTMFTNQKNDESGKLMQAWVMKNGFENGYIRITDGNTASSFLAGDANLDKKVDLSDALCILQYVANAKRFPLTSQAIDNADVYQRGDGITASDALSIQKLDAKVIKELPESYQK